MSAGGRTVEGDWGQTQRAWIEPKSGLVLRLEQRTDPPANSPMPPQRTVFLVKRLRFLPSVPVSRFQLPPGTVAHVPLIFQAVRLPQGVKRVAATGPYEGIGVGFAPDFHALNRKPGTR